MPTSISKTSDRSAAETKAADKTPTAKQQPATATGKPGAKGGMAGKAISGKKSR